MTAKVLTVENYTKKDGNTGAKILAVLDGKAPVRFFRPAGECQPGDEYTPIIKIDDTLKAYVSFIKK